MHYPLASSSGSHDRRTSLADSSPLTTFLPRASSLHRAYPLTKLTLAGVLIVVGLLMPWWGTYILFAGLMLPLAAWGQILRPYLRTVVQLLLPFAVPIVVIQGLFWTGGTPLLTLGPLSLKAEGLLFAAASLGRLSVLMGAFLLLGFTTRPDALMQSLVARGVPNQLFYLVVTTIQIVPRFLARANTILDAQRSRGLETEGNLLHRLRSIAPLVGPLILSSLIDIEERAIALEARAFNRPGAKTTLLTLHDTRPQAWLRTGLLLAALTLLAFRIYFALRS